MTPGCCALVPPSGRIVSYNTYALNRNDRQGFFQYGGGGAYGIISLFEKQHCQRLCSLWLIEGDDCSHPFGSAEVRPEDELLLPVPTPRGCQTLVIGPWSCPFHPLLTNPPNHSSSATLALTCDWPAQTVRVFLQALSCTVQTKVS